MCGADTTWSWSMVSFTGSPPRVRSRRDDDAGGGLVDGITSACAEQTRPGTWPGRTRSDHLRVCGADLALMSSKATTVGSPPRVRSRPWPVPKQRYGISRGITSACAEQTGSGGAGTGFGAGSPPRVRSRRVRARPVHRDRGITSACAEQTVVFYCVLSQLNGVEYLIYALRRVS